MKSLLLLALARGVLTLLGGLGLASTYSIVYAPVEMCGNQFGSVDILLANFASWGKPDVAAQFSRAH